MRKNKRTVLVAAALACGTLGACSNSAPATTPPPTTTGSTASAVTVSVPAVTVSVTNAGAEPRTVLTGQTRPETAQQVTLTTSSAINQAIGTNPPADQSSPDVTLPLTATAHGPSDAPTHTVGLTIGTPSSPDATLAAALAKAKGSTSNLLVGPDGAVKQLVLDPPAELSDAARSAVEQALRQAIQFALVLPSTPVGPGAGWTVSQQIDSLGLSLRQDLVFTLTQLRGSTLDLDVALTQTPLTPVWTLPNDQGTLNVDSYKTAGGGTLRVDLTKPVPVDGRVQLSGDQVFSRPKDGLKLAQHVSNGVSWKS